MAVQLKLPIQLFSLGVATFLVPGVVSTTFTITNNCSYTVWPGILSNADSSPLATTGFTLQQGETRTITAPASWGGRIWGRTHCSQDTTGKFTCLTGDCGGTLECSSGGSSPPTTLAEFKLDGYDGLDYFDVSLVNGYNLPLTVTPQGGSGQNCSSTSCVVDLNGSCPTELKVTSTDGESVACKSACEAFGQPEYCCKGAYSTAETCKPSSYSEIFKKACPLAHSYARDDGTSTFTCVSADYVITFCLSPDTSQKSSQEQNAGTPTTTTPPDGKMVDEGSIRGASSLTHFFGSNTVRRIFGILVAMLFSGSVVIVIKCVRPLAHSYARDDETSTFTAASAGYVNTLFSTRQKSSQEQNAGTPTTTAAPDGEMVDEVSIRGASL